MILLNGRFRQSGYSCRNAAIGSTRAAFHARAGSADRLGDCQHIRGRKGQGLKSPTDIAYASFAQNPVVGLGIAAKGSGDGTALIRSAAQAVTRVDKTQVLDGATTVEQTKRETLMSRRLTTSLWWGDVFDQDTFPDGVFLGEVAPHERFVDNHHRR